MAEMDAPQVVRSHEKPAPFDLAAKIGVFVPGVKRQAFVECDVVHRRVAVSHVAADIAAIGKLLMQNTAQVGAGVTQTDHGLGIVKSDPGGSRAVRKHGARQASDIRPRVKYRLHSLEPEAGRNKVIIEKNDVGKP